jgi:hypothetical protein
MSVHRLCAYCQEPYQAEIRYLNRGQGLYCSRSCSAKATHPVVDKVPNTECAWCKKDIYVRNSRLRASKSGLNFCSNKCHNMAAKLDGGIPEVYPPHFNQGSQSYRRRALIAYGRICAKCAYKEDSRMLDVDHINSNRQDNTLKNLQVLCVWCHALKTRANWPKDN